MEKNKLEILTASEIEKLLNQFSLDYPSSLRNKTIIKLMIETGIRPNELIELNWNNISLNKKIIEVDDRKFSVSMNLIKLLDKWKATQNEFIECPKYVFTTITKDSVTKKEGIIYNTYPGKQLSSKYLYAMLKRAVDKAELSKQISPMSLRHTFAVNFYRKKQNLKSLQNILGLINLSDAKIYKEFVEYRYQKNLKRLLDIYKQ